MPRCKWSVPHRLVMSEDKCFREIVLSLDGGGMRGYSSLLIIENLMTKISEAERAYNMASNNDTITSLWNEEPDYLPAHYFDFTVGTSTGGLIAIMLGRLRMKIDDCLKEYEKFGKDVFGKRRFYRWNQYDHRILERVLKKVIKEYTRETEETALFTQPEPNKRTCRTAVMAVRRNPAAGDEAFIFRSYPFTGPLFPDQPLAKNGPLNPEGNGKAYIWQAARATSAAPHYFKDIDINGNRFMDGAVQINNPSYRAWCEACAMHHGREEPNQTPDFRKPAIGVFVSIGTGKSAPLTMFNDKNLLRHVARIGKAAIKRLSNPEETHDFMSGMFAEQNVPYFRFNVDTGLENIKMDDCSEKTLHTISKATKEYLTRSETKKQLRSCAEFLVAHRRGRNPTDEERRIRDIHLNLLESNETSEDETSTTTKRCSCCQSRLSTPISGTLRSRSTSVRSSASALAQSSGGPATAVVGPDGHLCPPVPGQSRNRADSGAESCSRHPRRSREDCPATAMERRYEIDVLRLRPSRTTLTEPNETVVRRSCSP